jgi:serine/threonine-protein kinase
VEICRVINNRGGTWGEHGVIAFSPDRYNAALWQVPDAGGEPKPLTALADGERTQRWPQFLQNGNAVLFTGNDRADGFGNANVVVQTLPDGPRKVLVRGAYFGRYLPSGHLVYVHSGTLFAAPFDPDRLELTGPAVPALEGALVNPPVGAAEIAISGEGTVAFLPASEQASTLAAPLDWMDRRGATTPLLRDTPVRWLFPRFAPDGRRLAFSLFDGKEQDVWVYDWSAEALSRVTFDPGGDLWPVWTPDGRRIVFLSNRDGAGDLYWQRVDGTGEVQRLTRSSRPQYPGSWHPDGRTLVFFEDDPATSTRNVMALRIGGDEASGWQPGRPTLVLSGADRPMLSPDGRWLAYVSRTATPEVTEVFVRSFPGPGGPWQVSTAGGTDPLWSSTRPEIFYATPDHRIMAASYSVSGGFRVEKPHLLSEARFTPRSVGRHFDIHPDGNRFALAGAPPAQTGSSREHVTLIFNFFDHLRRIAPPGARSGLPWRLP